MPKLLQINSASNVGSTGKIVEQIGLLASDYGWDCYVAHGARYIGNSRLPTFQVSPAFEEKCHWVKSVVLDAHGFGSEKGTKRFVEWLEEIKPDVAHLHNIHGYFVNIPILFNYIYEKGIPVVWTLHDCWSFTGHCVYFDRVGCNRWLEECGRCPQLSSYPRSLFLDRSSRNLRMKRQVIGRLPRLTLVPVSEWLGDLVKQSYLGKYPVHVIHNGIDLNVFKPTVSDLKKQYGIEGKFVVLGVADIFGDRKGLEEFIQLHQSYGDDIQVVLVGVSEEEKKRLPEGIIALRRTTNVNQLVEFYSMADVFANPTYEDNFPTTNIEALACGTPVITYLTGGSPEAVDENTGIVVEKGNYNAFVEAINKIRKNGKASYSNACRKRAVEQFNKDDRFLDYIKLYDEIINR